MLKSSLIIFSVLVTIILSLFVFPFYNPDSGNSEQNGKLTVTVTIYPTYDIVKNIAGDKVNLFQIIPFGREPHSFEPTPKDIIRISNSQLFIYTGMSVDSWAINLGDMAKKRDKFIKLADSSKIIDNDPHFWLDTENFKNMATKISENIMKLDPINQKFYQANLTKYLKKLDRLNSDYQNGLNSCKLDSIIVNHNAFKYLERAYNFRSFAVMGISPDDKPSAKALADIVDIVKEKNVSTIFFEELVSSNVIDTIANETGVEVSSLSPLGNIAPEQVKIGYINLMYKNLDRLKEALICQ